MNQEATDHEPVEEPDEEPALFVVDPDEYQETQKLKAISDTKKQFRKMRNSRPNTAKRDDWQGIRAREAEAVALYGSELLPIIEDAIDQGLLSENDLDIEYVDTDVRSFVMYDGRTVDENGETQKPNPQRTMAVYRQLNRIQRKLGLGLELQEDKEPAQI